MKQFFRHKKTGVIFHYNALLLTNEAVELVTEQQAFPERFAAKAVLEHKPQVDITIHEQTEAPPYVAPELLAEGSRKFGSPKAKKISTPQPTPVLSSELLGLKGEI